MGRLEKYGVCALLFVIVTVLAVSIWGPRPRKGSAASGAAAAPSSASAEPRAPSAGPTVSPSVAVGGVRPLGEPASPAEAAASPTPLLPSAGPAPSPFDGPGIPLPGTANPASSAGSSTGRAARYVVKKGETLDVIAKRELGSAARWDEILKWNEGLDPKRLRAGQEILLPPGRASLASAAPAKPSAPVGPAAGAAPLSTEAASAAAAKSERKHRVAKGDTLYAISKHYYGRGGRFGDILAANRGVLSNEHDLRVGMTLVIP
jgi:nucleoid-associated protein YgaU